jgi:hypothetical protein
MAWLSKCKDLPKLQAGWKPKVESAMCNLCQNPSKIPVCGIWAPARRFEVASSGYFCHKGTKLLPDEHLVIMAIP